MKRNIELVRRILLYFESRESVSLANHDEVAEAVSEDVRVVAYHIRLMAEANLLRCEVFKSTTSDRIIDARPFELTWEGHEFLNLSRDSVWSKIKAKTGDGFFDLAFGIVRMLLEEEVKRRVGLSG